MNKRGKNVLYIIILIAKILENTLSTLRIILIANRKKLIGALLQGIIVTLWIITAGIVIIDIQKDILKIVFFVLGSIIGSYLGSSIEEKFSRI